MSNSARTSKLSLLAALAQQSQRKQVASQLAACYGADDLIIFCEDKDIGIFLPAAGFTKNLKGGPEWQAFLRQCEREGRAQADLQFAHCAARTPVLGVCVGVNAVLALVGTDAAIAEQDELLTLLPLLVWGFTTESSARASSANSTLAREKELSAELLAQSLDKARSKLAVALVDANQAQDALRAADKRKDEFLAMLAHELRNPLAPLGNGIELLKHAQSQPQLLPELRQMMANQIGQMSRLIDDLMDVSRITRGTVVLRCEDLPLQRIIDLALESVRPFAAKNHQTVTVALPPDSIVVHGDEARLAQVFTNLLQNAVKYTPAGGDIRIGAEVNGGEVVVAVEDTGVGLEGHDLDHIFDLFVQINRSTSNAHGGLGVGLTLAKTLVELHGGKVAAHSAGRGSGSTFTVALPLQVSAQPAAPTDDRKTTEAECGLRVLVVDDNEESASTLSMLMEMMGHSTAVAFRGVEALNKAAHLEPHVVLLDIGLPDISGFDVCEQLRHSTGCRAAVIVAQTGWGEEKDKQKAQQAGFDHFLVKPVAAEDLYRIIDNVQAAQV